MSHVTVEQEVFYGPGDCRDFEPGELEGRKTTDE